MKRMIIIKTATECFHQGQGEVNNIKWAEKEIENIIIREIATPTFLLNIRNIAIHQILKSNDRERNITWLEGLIQHKK